MLHNAPADLDAGPALVGPFRRDGRLEEVAIESIAIEASGYAFDALAAGPEDGELVMLLHGFPQTSFAWRPQLQALAQAGYRAVAPDQRGYSPGARPTEVAAYAVPNLVLDVVAIGPCGRPRPRRH